MLDLGFVLLLAGYAVVAGLAPLSGWLRRAQSAAPAPVALLLAAALPNVAVVALLRLRGVLDASPGALSPGPPLIAFGLASVLLAGAGLWWQRRAGRVAAVAGLGQTGITVFAFGLGGPLASFAGLLHLTLQTLARTALAHALVTPGQPPGQPSSPAFALALPAAVFALVGLPPSGLFASEYLVVTETMRSQPWLALPLGAGLLVGGAALARRMTGIVCARAASGPSPGVRLALVPVWIHLAVLVLLGFAMPAALADWFATVAASLG